MDGKNYFTVPTFGAKGKAVRKRPMINIDISAVKSQIGKKSVNSVKSSAGGPINTSGGALGTIKEAPKVEVGNIELAASDTNSNNIQSQIQHPEVKVELRPLKEEAPVPFGITVKHESQSEASPAPTHFQKSASNKPSDINLGNQQPVTKFD